MITASAGSDDSTAANVQLRTVELRKLHAAWEPLEAAPPTIDDATWKDLDLDQVVERVAGRCSQLGQVTLHSWLRAPATSFADLPRIQDRRRLIDRLSVARSSEEISAALSRLPRLPATLLEVLTGRGSLPSLGWAPRILTLAAALTVLLLNVSTQVGVFAIGTALVVNTLYRIYTHPKSWTAKASLTFAQEALRVAYRLQAAQDLPLEGRREGLDMGLRVLRPLTRALRELEFPGIFDQFPGEHLRAFLLVDERRLTRSVALIEKYRLPLARLVVLLGEVEASLAIAEFISSRPGCTPALSADPTRIQIEEVRHPLIEPELAVGSDLTLSGGLVITGSNMSGKSTFLRATALAALFAQSIGWVCARTYRAAPVRVATSLRNEDRLSKNESYYFAEALRLRTLLEGAAKHPASLIVVDEPFRGTNSSERIGAAAAVLGELRRAGARVLAATHDGELGALLTSRFEEGHFADECTASGLRFDYRLRAGPATTRNAIHLLRSLGYPETVTAEAAGFVTKLDGNRLVTSRGPALLHSVS